MQRVRYVNLRGETVDFSAHAPLILAHVEGIGVTEAKISAIAGAYQSGESMTRMQRGVRIVYVQFALRPEEDTREAMYRARMEMATRLSTGRCMDADGHCGRLYYTNDAGSWWTYAVPDGEGPTYGTRINNILPGGRISFRSGSAYWRSVAEYEERFEMAGGGFKLPFTFPIRFGSSSFVKSVKNEGGADAPVSIVIYGTGETPTIKNHTTGAQITIERAIASGERLEISTDPEALSCVHVLTDGTREDAWGYISAESEVAGFTLTPGENAVEYIPSQTASGSRVEMRWHALYEGV